MLMMRGQTLEKGNIESWTTNEEYDLTFDVFPSLKTEKTSQKVLDLLMDAYYIQVFIKLTHFYK